MKKKGIILIITLVVLFLPVKVLGASPIKAYITDTNTILVKSTEVDMTGKGCLYKPNTNYAAPGILHCLDSGDSIQLTNIDNLIPSTVASCSQGFYEMSYTFDKGKNIGKTYSGYVCASNVRTNVDITKYAEEFKAFPESYLERLTVLKDSHPNWKFTAYKTNIDWNTAITNESNVEYNSSNKKYWSRSYIQTNNELYLSKQAGSYDPSVNKYMQMEVGGWYAANKDTVAYYMDPRNFLDAGNVFMFENLSYNSNYQTLAVVQNILAGTDLLNYANSYIEAATYNNNNISPIHLSARSRQEVVIANGKLSRSANGEGKINDIPYYNTYNLGAYSSCDNPVDCAIDFASGYSGTNISYNRPWTTLDAAIKNGASIIASGYIKEKQDTLYFQRWNVTGNGYGNFSHQYMTNISAPLSEATSTQKSYSEIPNLLNNAIEFIIPVYDNMPNTAAQLPTVIPNETISISEIIASAGYGYSSGYLTGVKIGTTIATLQQTLTNAGATIKMTPSQTRDKDLSGTGDLLEITSGNTSEQLRIVINGDTNGDGKVNSSDYVNIRNHMMEGPKLNGSYYLAADVDGNGNIGSADYVNIKNYIMGNPSTLR